MKTFQIPGIIIRIGKGLIFGGFIGILEIWFYEFSMNRLLSAFSAGVAYGILIGVFCVFFQKLKNYIISLISFLFGNCAGYVWWLIAYDPGVPLIYSILIGGALGIIIALEVYGKSHKFT